MEALYPIYGYYDPIIGEQGLTCEESALPALQTTAMVPCSVKVTPSATCQQPGVACCASELEEDIAALEEEANRAADAMDWSSPSEDGYGSCATGMNKVLSTDLEVHEQDQAASDSSSDDELDQPEDDITARIHANARLVQQLGKPLQQGAWKGCTKSAWCDRENKHRGLCNHRATIPGPAACTPQSVACSQDKHEDSCAPSSMDQHHQQQQLSSGGHSRNCQDAVEGDEREVASAYKSGSTSQQVNVQEANMPFSCLPQLQEQQAVVEPQLLQHQQQQYAEQQPDLLWDGCSTYSQAAACQQLFALPAFYQPRVKDLEAPDISSMLSGDLCCVDTETTNIEVPVVEPVELDDLDIDDTIETSCQTFVKPGFSTPSSPSYVSAADKAQSGAFSVSVPAPPATTVLPSRNMSAVLLAASSGCLPAVCLPGMLPLEEVHPTCSSAAAAVMPQPSADVAVLSAAPKRARADVMTLLRRSSSSGSSANQALAGSVAAAATTTASDAAAAAGEDVLLAPASQPVSSVITAAAAVKAPAAKASTASAAAAKPASVTDELKLPPPMQRAPRIKYKPRRADDPPRPLLEPSSSSISNCSPNKAKKRPAGRMAANPSSEHSCAQCGAVSTPVWRAGPAGPKTLCNACGVRYMKTSRRK